MSKKHFDNDIEETIWKHDFDFIKEINDYNEHLRIYRRYCCQEIKMIFDIKHQYVSFYYGSYRIPLTLHPNMVKAIYDKCKELKMVEVEDEEQ